MTEILSSAVREVENRNIRRSAKVTYLNDRAIHPTNPVDSKLCLKIAVEFSSAME